jgi:hypothetical protein
MSFEDETERGVIGCQCWTARPPSCGFAGASWARGRWLASGTFDALAGFCGAIVILLLFAVGSGLARAA